MIGVQHVELTVFKTILRTDILIIKFLLIRSYRRPPFTEVPAIGIYRRLNPGRERSGVDFCGNNLPCPDSLSRFPVQNPLSIERGRNSGPPVNISGFEVLCDTVQKTVISYFVDVQGGSFLLLSCLQEQTRLKQARKPGVASSEPQHTYQLKRFKIPCWVLCVSVCC